MERIKGFDRAREVLSRWLPVDYNRVSPALASRLKDMFGTGDPEQAVRYIVDEVRRSGDAALRGFTSKIDGIDLKCLEVDRRQIAAAYKDVDEDMLSALKLAARRVTDFHEVQLGDVGKGFEHQGLGQVVRSLQRVGLYVPGGTAAYPSTVLMTAIPARVAGVRETILATAPQKGGGVPAATLVAADIAGVDRVFSVGGAQAIAAMAFGTESIPKVDKICGPGNMFVVLAKKMVFGVVDIDGLQGPSEVVVIADDGAEPVYCAADILAQAEHDMQASVILITTSEDMAERVESEIETQLASLSRKDIAAEALANGGRVVIVGDIGKAIELANLYAPEHLILAVRRASEYVKMVNSAGCVFLGNRSTVVLGDYIAGPSHVLPTGGTARFSSPLNVTDFLKFINVVNLDDEEIKRIGPAASVIARAEGLEAHAMAMEKRLEK